MIRLMAEYRIKEGTMETVQTAIKNFVTAVHKSEPETEYTSQLVEVLYPNCDETPSFTSIKIIE